MISADRPNVVGATTAVEGLVAPSGSSGEGVANAGVAAEASRMAAEAKDARERFRDAVMSIPPG